MSSSKTEGDKSGGFESNKSFNRCSKYAKHPLDLDMLSKYCTLFDGYAVFSLNIADRMWTLSPRPSCHS